MLRIRKEQVATLQDHALTSLKLRMQAQLELYWAPLCEQLGADGVVFFVDHAIQRCSFYGVEQENDHMRYLNAMALLGADFDEELDWVGHYMENRNVRGGARIGDLCAAIMREVNS